ncbi:MAG: hypothetical protein HYR62_04170 [Actinobacteria bacterium]|nr:hypothetical protein [Actinomycetota bacterium]MBI3686603.1 hypothetical protein [Actinomycetota bacterium]
MDFAKSLMVLLRRWYVALPALALSLGLAAVVFEAVPAKYASAGTIVLLSPSTGTGAGGTKSPTNPLLAFDGSLTTVSTALIQVMLSSEVGKDLASAGATADYEVGDGNLGGPFIHVEATGASPAEAQRTVGLVLERTSTELRDREVAYRAPLATYIQVDYLVRPSEAKRLLGSKVRAAGAALALALAFSISSAFMIESIMENRRNRRRPKAAAGQPVGMTGPPLGSDRSQGVPAGGRYQAGYGTAAMGPPLGLSVGSPLRPDLAGSETAPLYGGNCPPRGMPGRTDRDRTDRDREAPPGPGREAGRVRSQG